MARPASTSDGSALPDSEASGAASGEASVQQTDTLAWVTWLRIIAIFGVVSIHSVGSTAADEASRQRVDGWVAVAMDIPWLFAVPVFVMLSGVLLLDPGRFTDTGTFLRKRVARLVPALLFWNAVYLTYMVLTRPSWSDGPVDLLGKVLTGRVAPHLYFLFVVLGLALVTPVLVRWIAATGRREWLVGAAVAYTVPVLSTWPLSSEGTALGLVHTAWTWWIPYVGAFVLGWALRSVVLSRRAQAWSLAVVLVLMVELSWQWRNDAAPGWLQDWAGVGYYSVPVAVLSTLVLLLAQSAIRPGGPLGVLTTPRVMRWAEPVGAATMGIFGLHFLLILVSGDLELFGPPVTTWPMLLARWLVVSAVTLVLVLLLRRVPVLRRVL